MAKVTAQGTLVQLKIAGVYTTIPYVTEVAPPKQERTKIDFTDLSDVAMQNKKGIINNNQLTFKINYDPDNSVHQALNAAFLSDDPSDWQVVFANSGATTQQFLANLNGFEPNGLEVDGKLQNDLTADVTGEITVS